jgi:hypothetical protein
MLDLDGAKASCTKLMSEGNPAVGSAGFYILLYIISRGVNWIAGIAFPVYAVMTCVRFCLSSVHSSAEYRILRSRRLGALWFSV